MIQWYNFSNGLDNINLDDINLDDNTFDYCDPETLRHVRIQVGVIDVNKRKHVKKKIDEELLPAVWNPTRDCVIGACHKMKKRKYNQL